MCFLEAWWVLHIGTDQHWVKLTVRSLRSSGRQVWWRLKSKSSSKYIPSRLTRPIKPGRGCSCWSYCRRQSCLERCANQDAVCLIPNEKWHEKFRSHYWLCIELTRQQQYRAFEMFLAVHWTWIIATPLDFWLLFHTMSIKSSVTRTLYKLKLN